METHKYETGLKRLGAAIVDGIVFIPVIFFDKLFSSDISVNIVWAIFTGFLLLFYSVFLHYKYGQTIGKWVVGVKVLDISEARGLTLKQSIMRDSFNIGSEALALIYLVVLIKRNSELISAFEKYRNFANQPGAIWIVLELITMTFNNKRRAIHDFLAKSVVVRV